MLVNWDLGGRRRKRTVLPRLWLTSRRRRHRCGVQAGLIGGYLGAFIQPKLPEEVLRVVLGTLALATAVLYVWQALH